jgi:hypothetical protein
MSWNATIPGPISANELDAVELKVTDPSPEVQEQFEAGKLALVSLLADGTLGGTDKKFKISLHGHANPKHEPAAGYVNDGVHLTVEQAS